MLPTVRLVIQQGASHYPWLDDAGRFVAAAAMTEAYIGSSVPIDASAGGRPAADGIFDPDLDVDVGPELRDDAPQGLWRVVQDQAQLWMRLHERYQLAGTCDVDEAQSGDVQVDGDDASGEHWGQRPAELVMVVDVHLADNPQPGPARQRGCFQLAAAVLQVLRSIRHDWLRALQSFFMKVRRFTIGSQGIVLDEPASTDDSALGIGDPADATLR